MEDKEREFYFQWITQCMQLNMQMMNSMMQMAMHNMMQMPNIMATSPMMSKDMINDLLKTMTSGGDLAEKFNKAMFGKFDDKDKLT